MTKKDKEKIIKDWKQGVSGSGARNPAGDTELDEEMLEEVSGGFGTERLGTDGCCGATAGTGTCAAGGPTQGCCGSDIGIQ